MIMKISFLNILLYFRLSNCGFAKIFAHAEFFLPAQIHVIF